MTKTPTDPRSRVSELNDFQKGLLDIIGEVPIPIYLDGKWNEDCLFGISHDDYCKNGNDTGSELYERIWNFIQSFASNTQ